MVFALGGGRKWAGRRNNPRARHARQSRKDHAASSSRPLCPPFFYISARNRARSPSQPLASWAFPMSFAACGCDLPQRRRSKPIDRQPFNIRLPGRRFASRFRAPFCADAQCARLSVSMAPWGSYGRLPGETQMKGRLIRACSGRRLRRFDPAGRKNPTRPKPWPSPAPISTNPAARRPGADKKTKPILIFHAIPTVCRRNMNNPRSGILIGAPRNFLPALAKPREESVCWGARPSLPRPARRQCVIGDSMARVCRRMSKAAIDAAGGSAAAIRRAFFGHRRKFPLTIGVEFCRIRISAVGARCGFLAPLGVFPDSSVGRAVDC